MAPVPRVCRSSFAAAIAAVACAAIMNGCSAPSEKSPTGPSGNHPPTIGGIDVSPQGTGLMGATLFTFTAQNAKDADGDVLTYSWDPGDSTAITSSTGTGAHVFPTSGRFTVFLKATDSHGEYAITSKSITVGNVSGTWDLTCQNIPAPVLSLYPNFPRNFVATLVQNGPLVAGSLAANGLSHAFTVAVPVSDVRSVTFGVEGFDNVWAPRDGDHYFHMTLNATLTSMTGSGQYCGASVGTKR